MYKILTLPTNDAQLESVLLNNQTDYLSFIKDNNYFNESGVKLIMFGKPKCYPAILVTHFSKSRSRGIDQTIYGQYFYPNSFNANI